MQSIADEAALDAAFAAPRYLLLKHSPACPISGSVRMEVQAFAADHPDLPTGVIDVLDGRALSQAVAARTGIRHESPQALLLLSGEVVWHGSHWRVTESNLEAAVEDARAVRA